MEDKDLGYLIASLDRRSLGSPIDPSFYDEEYFTAGTKSNYKPYGPGSWAAQLARFIERLDPVSVLDVGCAHGYVVKELVDRKIDAFGFDCSEYAIQNSVIRERTWVGFVDDVRSWRYADLIFTSEVLEHLVWSQIKAFFRYANRFGSRILALIATGKASGDVDASHITLQPMSWWCEVASAYGFERDSRIDSEFNMHEYSIQMGWAGRFVYWVKRL